jgi:hypothetical protein
MLPENNKYQHDASKEYLPSHLTEIEQEYEKLKKQLEQSE